MAKKKLTIDDLGLMMKKGFDEMDEKISGVKGDLSGVKGDLSGVKGDLSGVKGELVKMRSEMVTKDYLDEKMADLRGDLVVLVRKEDNKMRKLVDILKKRRVISEKDVEDVLAMEPFPELSLHLKEKT